jgi:hypothetical protein
MLEIISDIERLAVEITLLIWLLSDLLELILRKINKTKDMIKEMVLNSNSMQKSPPRKPRLYLLLAILLQD